MKSRRVSIKYCSDLSIKSCSIAYQIEKLGYSFLLVDYGHHGEILGFRSNTTKYRKDFLYHRYGEGGFYIGMNYFENIEKVVRHWEKGINS